MSPITLLGLQLVDREVGTFFFCYNDKSNIVNRLSCLLISTIPKHEHCLVTLQMVRSDATPPLEFVFMNKESKNKELFYTYECLFQDLHVKVPFDDFTMGVLHIFNMALS